jgi:nitrogen fixation protein NifQ
MTPQDIYQNLMRATQGSGCNTFDAHVTASVFVLGWQEAAGDSAAFLEAVGLAGSEVEELVDQMFPELSQSFRQLRGLELRQPLSEVEQCLRELLRANASTDNLARLIGGIVARRAQKPNHLWQDLGLRNRRELGWLMERHFFRLFERNSGDMKWKKYLYRVICKDEGIGLCVAPSCEECCDYEGCFGEEAGSPLIAARAS